MVILLSIPAAKCLGCSHGSCNQVEISWDTRNFEFLCQLRDCCNLIGSFKAKKTSVPRETDGKCILASQNGIDHLPSGIHPPNNDA